MDEETIIYLAFTALITLIAIEGAGSFGKGIAPLIVDMLALLTLGFLLLFTFADFVIFPLFTTLLGVSFQPVANYYIVKRQNAVVKNVNGIFYATGYISANLFAYSFKEEREEEDVEDQMKQAPEKWERAISSIHFPFKYHVLSSGMDVQKVRDELEGKRSYQEFQLSRALQSQGSNDVTITNIQRNINMIQAKIDRISQGEKPVATLMYIETTAVGISEKAAIDMLDAQVKQLQVALSSLDVDLMRIEGRELYSLFMYSFALPTSFEDITAQFSQQG
jgi:hypothetical protein